VPLNPLEKIKAFGPLWLHYDVTMNRKASTNGSVKKRPASVRVPLTIRLPEEVIKRIDEDLGQRDVPIVPE
jgi:hypothetical protein